MHSDALIAFHERLAHVEAQLEELRHVMLCLCLQVTPPDGLGYDLKARTVRADGPGHPLYRVGALLETQEHEISKLAAMLMDQTMGAAGENPRMTRDDLQAALEHVRNRRQNRPKLPPAENVSANDDCE